MIKNITNKIFIALAAVIVFVAAASTLVIASENWIVSNGYDYYYYNAQDTLTNPIIVEIIDPEDFLVEYAVDTTLQIPYAAEFNEVAIDGDSYLKIESVKLQNDTYYQKLSLVTPAGTTILDQTVNSEAVGDWYFRIRKKLKGKLPGPNEHVGWVNIDGYHYFFFNADETFNNPIIVEVNNTINYDVEYAVDTTFYYDYPNYKPTFHALNIPQNSYLRIETLFDYDKADEFGVGMYYQTLSLVTPTGTTILDQTESSGFEDGWFFRIRQRIKEAPEIPDEIIPTEVANLPLTAQNQLGRVYFYIDGYNLVVQIIYNKVYYLEYAFDYTTDMCIFEYTEAYYLNIDGNPSIFINHSDFLYLSDIMLAPEDELPAFVPHTIWDLKTNNLKTISEYKAFAYIKQMSEGPIVAYVYIDDFIIDKILSMQISWTSRQHNGFPMSLWKKYTDWEQHIETYTDDDYLSYRDLYTSWQHLIPVWQFIKLGKQLTTYYEMPRIQALDWNNLQSEYNVTKTEVESYFHKLDNNFSSLKTNPRYKVWGVALQGGKSTSVGMAKTQFYHNEDDLSDERNFHILHMTYETNGVLYETIGDHIDLKVEVHEGLLPKESASLWSIIAILAAFLILFSAFKAKAFSSPTKALEFIIGTAIIIAFILIGYNLLKNGDFLKLGP